MAGISGITPDEVTFMGANGRQVPRIPGILIRACAGKSLVIRRQG